MMAPRGANSSIYIPSQGQSGESKNQVSADTGAALIENEDIPTLI
jgi:hypothetical protein